MPPRALLGAAVLAAGAALAAAVPVFQTEFHLTPVEGVSVPEQVLALVNGLSASVYSLANVTVYAI